MYMYRPSLGCGCHLLGGGLGTGLLLGLVRVGQDVDRSTTHQGFLENQPEEYRSRKPREVRPRSLRLAAMAEILACSATTRAGQVTLDRPRSSIEVMT